MAETSEFEAELQARSGGGCELCGNEESTEVYPVPHSPALSGESCVWMCATCSGRIGEESLDDKDWFCLKEAAWSEHAAVQVVSVRLLRRMSAIGWAQELADQIYMDEATAEWADAGSDASEQGVPTFDSNGTELFDGDAVTLVKDLDVKGASFVAKRGTLVKGIRLTGDPENIEGRVNKIGLVLKTCFLKKA
jgi:protein PhnA